MCSNRSVPLSMGVSITALRRWGTALIGSAVFLFLLKLLFSPSRPVKEATHISSPQFRKEFVVPALQNDNNSWLQEFFPDWKANIYVVNNPAAPLTVPVNKGKEAMVYLTFMIDNYDNLPDVMVFIHSHRYQWHNDDPIYDGVPILQNMQIPYIMSEGYANLRCVWTLGCPNEIDLHKLDSDKATEIVYPQAFQELFPGRPLPEVVAVACCAQFAVTRDKVRQNPRTDYEHYRKWLIETPLEDDTSGRVLEYAWHIIFGKPPVHCPAASECYCKTFGLCDMDCSINQCGERWPYPPFASLPDGWPTIGWDGEVRSAEQLAAMRTFHQ